MQLDAQGYGLSGALRAAVNTSGPTTTGASFGRLGCVATLGTVGPALRPLPVLPTRR